MKLLIYLIWIVLSIILGILIIHKKSLKDSLKSWLYWLSLVITGLYSLHFFYTSDMELNKSKYYIKTEIKQEVLNGRIIKSDTIYKIEYIKPKERPFYY